MRWERIQPQVDLSDSSSGPGKRWGHTCNAVKGGRFVYVFGGFGGDGCLTNRVHVFDVERQIWTEPVISGVPPCPRDSHSCTTVKNNLFVFGGTDGEHYLNDLHVLDTSSNTWKFIEVRGEVPYTREAHSATRVGRCTLIFGGCGKVPDLDDEVFYNDLYVFNTEEWIRAPTTGTRPSARYGHTCSTWNTKIFVVGGEHFEGDYLSDVHILDTDTSEWRSAWKQQKASRQPFTPRGDAYKWKQLKTSGQALTSRGGHVTVAIGSNLYVFGGFADSQNLYNDLYVLDVETCVWSKIVAMGDGPSARFSSAAVSLGPYKAGTIFFFGGCDKNLEPLDDIYYLHTDGACEARFAQTPGRLSLEKQMKLKCKEQKEAVEQGETVFQAWVTGNSPFGYTIETVIDGKVLRGVLLSTRHNSSVQTEGPGSSSSGKRPGTLDADCDHREKAQRTLSKDSGGSSQQAGPVDPSDDANKKVAETVAVTSDDKDQDPSQLANVEPLRNEISTDVGGAAKASPGGDSSPQKQDEERVAAEDADTEPKE